MHFSNEDLECVKEELEGIKKEIKSIYFTYF
jgi:hypothetical protein